MPRTFSLAVLALVAVAALSAQTGPRVSAQTATPQASPQANPTATPQAAGSSLPTVPDPVAVTLDHTTTAFLALDFLQSNCGTPTAPAPTPRPACAASLTAVASGLAAARAASVLVVYSQFPGGIIVDPVAPNPGDPVVAAGADKFLGTNLDDILKQAGISTVVITGTGSNGAVLYTAFEASARGYTVVVAEDGISANSDLITQYSEWQLLTGPGTSNPQNTPLKPMAVTLSRTDLITYK